jgi:hypothetical protein
LPRCPSADEVRFESHVGRAGETPGATAPWTWIADLPRLTAQVAARVVGGRGFGLFYGALVTGDCKTTDLFLAGAALPYTAAP